MPRPRWSGICIKIGMTEKLRYVKPGLAGYKRIRKQDSFQYADQEGKLIRDSAILARIHALVLPPAWEQVWICPWPNGHLQATGTDARGRKQYRYHALWMKTRNENKYNRLADFGEKLPLIRQRLSADLGKRELSKEKVIALALRVMEETLIRVGNAAYERLYGSYGLTTLRNRHVRIDGSKVFFQFKGKKGVQHKIALKQTSLVRLLKRVMDIPGQELFQYYDENGEHKGIDSGEVNDYIKACTEDEFTCKDFRTWAGSVHALRLLADLEVYQSVTQCKHQIVETIKGVAGKLGNTTTVCKKYYIHPGILAGYEDGTLETYLRQLRTLPPEEPMEQGLHGDERIFLRFIHDYSPVK